MSFVAPAPVVEYIASASAMYAAPAPAVEVSCCKTCSLSLASDVGLGKVLYSVPFHDTWLVAGVHTFYITVCERRDLGDSGFLMFRKNACAMEIVARSRQQQHRPNCSPSRHETRRAAFGNVKTTL